MKAKYKPVLSVESSLIDVIKQETSEDFDYPWHYHPEYELTYIRKGSGVRYVGNSIENFQDDDLVLIGSNIPHSWINTKEQSRQPDAIVIYIKQEFFADILMQSREFEAIYKLLESSVKGIRFDKRTALKLKPKFKLLVELPTFEKFILFLQIMYELAQTPRFSFLCSEGFSYELNDTNNTLISRIYKYIQENYRQKIYLKDIAEVTHMSEQSFSKYFSKTMKKPFFEFLNEYRISKACKLLIDTDKQISEICFNSGFESIPFFYRQFKKFKKCQPKRYRANYLKAVAEAELQ